VRRSQRKPGRIHREGVAPDTLSGRWPGIAARPIQALAGAAVPTAAALAVVAAAGEYVRVHHHNPARRIPSRLVLDGSGGPQRRWATGLIVVDEYY